MPHHPHDPLHKVTPLERIFRKLIGRKMTELERISFHLKPVVKAVKPKQV
jgi:hypothetical protein